MADRTADSLAFAGAVGHLCVLLRVACTTAHGQGLELLERCKAGQQVHACIHCPHAEYRCSAVPAVFPAARVLGIVGLPANVYISDIPDIRTQALDQINTPDNLMALRMCARIAFWRYRAMKPQSFGGSNKMMITNISNKTRNMTKRQRRSKSKSKSKSKSMSMFKSAKRTFYKMNKRSKTSRRH